MEPMTFDTPDGLRLELRIPAGEITVRAVETAQTRLEINGERDPEDFRIACEPIHTGGQRLTVEQRNRAKLFGWNSGDLRVEVTVPVGADVDAQTGSADLEIGGAIGSLAFKSGSGECRFERVGRDASIKTASGELSGGTVGGDLTFHSASGDARVREIAGRVVGGTASGDVSLGSVGGSLEVTTVSGDLEVAALSTGSASVRAVSGDVEIGVVRGTVVFLDLHSTSGRAVAELDMSGDAAGGAGPADLELHVGTVSGDVRIYRAVEAATPNP